MSGSDDIRRAAELAARLSYGQLLAFLSRSFRDLAAAEDALADAFSAALATWPTRGVPANPAAWLLVAARNRLLDAAKARRVRSDAVETLIATTDTTIPDLPAIPDKRLELMFVCAHPAIDAGLHAPLMLQTVLGIDAARIGSCFLVAPATMGQRLSRAKRRIRETGIRFETPDADDVAMRAVSVREAIFAAYATGWDAVGGQDAARSDLAGEAVWLAKVLVSLTPRDAEAHGLLATMLFSEARLAARYIGGRYIPLREQDVALWDRSMLRQAEETLHRAAGLNAPGRFQIEAAIQSASVQSVLTGRDLAHPILALHRSLIGFAPTLGNLVAYAAAAGEAGGAQAGLAELDRIDRARVVSFQPWWAVRAHLLAREGGRRTETVVAYERAIGLCESAPERAYLAERLALAVR